MEFELIHIFLSIISFLLTTVVGLYITHKYNERKEYKNFLKRLNNIVGLGGKIIYKNNETYEIFQIKEISKQGVTLIGFNITVYVPIDKLMEEEIIVPEQDYEEIMKNLNEENTMKDQELEEFRQKRIAEIYAYSNRDMIKNYLFPELEKMLSESIIKENSPISESLEEKLLEFLKNNGYNIKKIKK
jgi:hypothetical protein